MRFLIKRTENAKDLPLPKRQTPLSAGMDLYANIQGDYYLKKGTRALIPTGICIALPEGYEAQVRPRSGLALHHGISMPNAPATVDADYRGELKVILINLGDDDFIIRRGDRIAQMVLAKIETADFEETDILPEYSVPKSSMISRSQVIYLSRISGSKFPERENLSFSKEYKILCAES